MRLHVEQLGSDGDLLVVLSAFGLDHTPMAAAIEPVFSELPGWRRLYVDLPGTGESPTLIPPQSDSVLDKVIDTILGELHQQRFAVLGWSYGGYIGAGVVRRLPDQVSGLMMVCSGFKIRFQDRNLSGVLQSHPQPGWLDQVPAHLHEHLARAVGHQTGEIANNIAAVVNANRNTDDGFLGSLRANGFALSNEGELPSTFNAPICFVAGKRDRIVGYASLLDALGHYENASLTCISGAGHYLPVEQPHVFASITKGWLQQCQSHLDHTHR